MIELPPLYCKSKTIFFVQNYLTSLSNYYTQVLHLYTNVHYELLFV